MLFLLLPSGPLATLAGVYQDVRGQRLEALWREAVSLWTDWLVEVLPALLENPQLRPLAQASVATLSIALDVVRNLLSVFFVLIGFDIHHLGSKVLFYSLDHFLEVPTAFRLNIAMKLYNLSQCLFFQI